MIVYQCILLKEIIDDCGLPKQLEDLHESVQALRDFDRFLLLDNSVELVNASR